MNVVQANICVSSILFCISSSHYMYLENDDEMNVYMKKNGQK
jgi:hypothetical protein